MLNDDVLKPLLPRSATNYRLASGFAPRTRSTSPTTTSPAAVSFPTREYPRNSANTTVSRQPLPTVPSSAWPGAMKSPARGPSQRAKPPVNEKFNKLFYTSPLPRTIDRIYKFQTGLQADQAAGPSKGSSTAPRALSSLSRSVEVDRVIPTATASPRPTRTAPRPSNTANAQQAVKNALDTPAAIGGRSKHRETPRRSQSQGANKKADVNVVVPAKSPGATATKSDTKSDISMGNPILSAFGRDIYDIPMNEPEETPDETNYKERKKPILKRRQVEKEAKITPQKRPPSRSPAQVPNKAAKISSPAEVLNSELPARARRSAKKQVVGPPARKVQTPKPAEPKKSAKKALPEKSETKIDNIPLQPAGRSQAATLPSKNQKSPKEGIKRDLIGFQVPPGILESTGTQWDPESGRRVSRRVSSGVREWWASATATDSHTPSTSPKNMAKTLERAKLASEFKAKVPKSPEKEDVMKVKAAKGKDGEQEVTPRRSARKSDAAKETVVRKDVRETTQLLAGENPVKKEGENGVSKTVATKSKSTRSAAKARPILNPEFEFSDEELD